MREERSGNGFLSFRNTDKLKGLKVVKRNLPQKNIFADRSIDSWTLVKEIGRGKIGVVYRASKIVVDSPIQSAIKLIPHDNLKQDWKKEIQKLIILDGVPQVIRYREHGAEELDDQLYAFIVCEYINGEDLNKYAKKNPSGITLAFVYNLLKELLELLLAMKEVGITHGDLHEGNILIAYDDRRYDPSPIIKVGDFGIGGSHHHMKPKDDYLQLANIIHNLLESYVDQANLGDSFDREFYKYLLEEFLTKNILESNPTTGDFVHNPRSLIETLLNKYDELRNKSSTTTKLTLTNPFDYLSCEQIGDSIQLLQTLYSNNFPGYDDLLLKANTIFTGPRGCGKTTIFKNLSLKTKLLGNNGIPQEPGDYIGIYYHCSDLYFPFHYLKDKVSEQEQKIILHYFNLAILRELFDTLEILANKSPDLITGNELSEIEQFIELWISSYASPPKGTNVLHHLLEFIDREKNKVGLLLRQLKKKDIIENFLNIDFIPKLCSLLHKNIGWLKKKPFYFFLDDFSKPHIREEMQKVLNDLIMFRWPMCYFKISTESIISFSPYDTSGKLIEETREYDVIDLGAYFIRKPMGSRNDEKSISRDRRTFLVEVINNRLKHTEILDREYKDIKKILGPNPYSSYNDLARKIRGDNKKKSHVYYAGIDTITDLFSGDIADILRLVRSIFRHYGDFSKPGLTLPIRNEIQDRAIREYGASFLNKVEAAPKTGKMLRKVAEAFGHTANWLLRNRISKNVAQKPPWQAFRIEIRDSFNFDKNAVTEQAYKNTISSEKQAVVTIDNFIQELKLTYDDLLKYGVFLRDVRGKSQRGAIVPRLYLRRLLIPNFLLTPNQRDSISLEVIEFLTLLIAPDKFNSLLRKKNEEQLMIQGSLF